MGGMTHFAAGSIRIEDPEIGGFPRSRGLIRFNLAGQIPANAVITSVKFNVSVTLKPPGGPGSVFQLHRVLRPWGEGNKTGNLGAAAGAGEATWKSPDNSNLNWGGASNADDAVTTPSSEAAIDAVARYSFQSTPALIADVQGWLANPAANYGWLLMSAAESVPQTARRFGSREAGSSSRPNLEITYTEAPSEIRIIEFRREQTGLFLRWTGGTPPYFIERTSAIPGGWSVVFNTTDTQATAPLGESISIYRIGSGTP